jgi:hypothetical protein
MTGGGLFEKGVIAAGGQGKIKGAHSTIRGAMKP